jgi:hypothetical protein
MKKILLLVMLAVCSSAFAVGSTTISTSQAGLNLLRNTDVNDYENVAAVLTVLKSAGDFAHKPAGAVNIGGGWSSNSTLANYIQLYPMGGAADNNTFDITVVGWRSENGPAEVVCYGSVTLGGQQVLKYPDSGDTATNQFWADTIVIDSNSEAWSYPAVFVRNGNAADGVASVIFNATGYKYIYVYVTDADNATSTEAGYVRIYWSYY